MTIASAIEFKTKANPSTVTTLVLIATTIFTVKGYDLWYHLEYSEEFLACNSSRILDISAEKLSPNLPFVLSLE
jgi:hypothetical protein